MMFDFQRKSYGKPTQDARRTTLSKSTRYIKTMLMGTSLVARNFISLLGSNFIVQGLRFLTVALLARRLGNELFGVYNYLILLASYGFTIVEFGLKNLAIREFAQKRGSGQFLGQIFKLRLIFSGMAGIAVILFAKQAFPAGEFLQGATYFALSLVVDVFLVDFLVIAQERLALQAWSNMAHALTLFLGSYFLVHSPQDFLLTSEIFFVSHIVWVGLLFVSAKPLDKNNGTSSQTSMAVLVTAALPFFIAQILGGFQYSMDLLLLGQFHYQSWLGDYSAAIKILSIPLGVINALVMAIQPKLARESHNLNSPEMQTVVVNSTCLIAVILAPTIIISWLFGEQLVFWLFGSQFIQSGQLLRPLSLALSLFCLGLAPMHGLFVSFRSRTMIKIASANFSVSLITVFIILILGKPQWVPWGMLIVQGFYLISAWRPYGFGIGFMADEFYFLALPLCLLAIPLLAPSALPAWFKFLMATAGYLSGLTYAKIWRKPWFISVLSRSS